MSLLSLYSLLSDEESLSPLGMFPLSVSCCQEGSFAVLGEVFVVSEHLDVRWSLLGVFGTWLWGVWGNTDGGSQYFSLPNNYTAAQPFCLWASQRTVSLASWIVLGILLIHRIIDPHYLSLHLQMVSWRSLFGVLCRSFFKTSKVWSLFRITSQDASDVLTVANIFPNILLCTPIVILITICVNPNVTYFFILKIRLMLQIALTWMVFLTYSVSWIPEERKNCEKS